MRQSGHAISTLHVISVEALEILLILPARRRLAPNLRLSSSQLWAFAYITISNVSTCHLLRFRQISYVLCGPVRIPFASRLEVSHFHGSRATSTKLQDEELFSLDQICGEAVLWRERSHAISPLHVISVEALKIVLGILHHAPGC